MSEEVRRITVAVSENMLERLMQNCEVLVDNIDTKCFSIGQIIALSRCGRKVASKVVGKKNGGLHLGSLRVEKDGI